MSKTLRSKSQRSFAKLNTQVRAACGPVQPAKDVSPATGGVGKDSQSNVAKGRVAKGEVSKAMADLYRRFLTEPSAERFFETLAAFELPANSAAPSLSQLDLAFSEGQFETVRTLVKLWARSFTLSIHFHRLAALAAFELGEVDDAELERFITDACLQGVLNSGEGTSERPYTIAHRTDAQEVLRHLNLQPIRQSSVDRSGSFCDVFEVRGAKRDQEVWFSPYSKSGRPASGAKARPKHAKKVAV
jgi:hypothetical protein